MLPRNRVTRARAGASVAPASADATSRRASSISPAYCLASAAASVRSNRRAGSAVRATERSRNAAAAARPPRLCARAADCSSSSATASSGPAALARRAGRGRRRHRDLRQRGCLCRSSSDASRTPERTSGWRNTTRTDLEQAASTAERPRRLRCRRAGPPATISASPSGSAADREEPLRRRRQLASRRRLLDLSRHRHRCRQANPPASSVDVRPRPFDGARVAVRPRRCDRAPVHRGRARPR